MKHSSSVADLTLHCPFVGVPVVMILVAATVPYLTLVTSSKCVPWMITLKLPAEPTSFGVTEVTVGFSTTTTLKVAVEETSKPSFAVQCTSVVPTGNFDPDAGVHSSVRILDTGSSAVTL